jgi:hypothetical protein
MGGRYIVRRREQLGRRQKNKCFWCQCTMVPIPPDNHIAGAPNRFPPAMITLDHIYHKGDPRRRTEPKYGEQRYVAACFDCNERRGREHEAAMGRAELQRRAKRPPRFTKSTPVSTAEILEPGEEPAWPFSTSPNTEP